jgi:hypothetical protein
VTTVDTFWDPTEYTNEAQAALFAHQGQHNMDIDMHVGSAVEPGRAPRWQLADGIGQSAQGTWHMAKSKEPRAKNQEPKPRAESQMLNKISQIVRTYVDLHEHNGLVFTAYCPDRPYDVLTEEMVGSGVAYKDNIGCAWFDVGNFDTPWRAGDEVICILEATKEGRGYVAVVSTALDETVDIQDIEMVSLAAIPEPTNADGDARWTPVRNQNVVGYSMYKQGKRLNAHIVTENHYQTDESVNIRLVFQGGHETVYSSGTQTYENQSIPRDYAFSVVPSLCVDNASINYALPRATVIDVSIYDISGRKVASLASGRQEPGYYTIMWDGLDDRGHKAAAGIYFVRCVSEEYTNKKKIIVLK